ncbi:MAG: hypothetical protein ACE5E8_08005 [Acidimicrobiia bacterium]
MRLVYGIVLAVSGPALAVWLVTSAGAGIGSRFHSHRLLRRGAATIAGLVAFGMAGLSASYAGWATAAAAIAAAAAAVLAALYAWRTVPGSGG